VLVKKVLLFLLCLVLVAGCKKKNEKPWLGEATPNPTATETTGTGDDPTHPASPGGTAVVPDATGGTTVVVLLEDGHLAVQTQAIPPGPAVLTVTNGGKETHNLTVEGPGVAVTGDPLPAGNTRPIDANFQVGTYTLYCPILDHRTKGEQTTVTITR
jgi:hypothetical protein